MQRYIFAKFHVYTKYCPQSHEVGIDNYKNSNHFYSFKKLWWNFTPCETFVMSCVHFSDCEGLIGSLDCPLLLRCQLFLYVYISMCQMKLNYYSICISLYVCLCHFWAKSCNVWFVVCCYWVAFRIWQDKLTFEV